MSTAVDFMNFVFLVMYDKPTQIFLIIVLISVTAWLVLCRRRRATKV